MNQLNKGLMAILLGCLCIGSSNSASAQLRLTLHDVVPGGSGYWDHQPEMPRVLGVHRDGLILFGTESLDIQGLNGAKTPLVTKSAEKRSSILVPYSPTEYPDLYATMYGSEYHLYDAKSHQQYSITMGSDDQQYALSPIGRVLATSDGRDVYLNYADGRPRLQITHDGSLDIANGDVAHRSEFGISNGLFFSPTGRYLAYYRIDRTHVTSYPIVRMTSPIATSTPIKYPMAGQASEEVTIGIYDTKTQQTIMLQTGAPRDRYLTNLSWSPDERHLYIDEVDRNQQLCKLVSYDVSSGKAVREILQERNDRYIEPMHPITFVPGDPHSFVRLSRVDGFNHLYLYDTSGRLRSQLTSGTWEIIDFMGLSPDGKYAFFTSNKDYIPGCDLYRVELRSKRVERITQGQGTHQVMLSQDRSMVYDSFSSHDNPGEAWLIHMVNNKVQRQLVHRAQAPSAASQLNATVELGTLRSSDGTADLYYKLTRPKQLIPGQRYPVIVYVYGGPHSQLVTDSWRGLRVNWDSYMADKGYIVFTLDGRGTNYRGHEFESTIHRRLGTVEMQDQMTGVDYLRTLPYVDPDRIGVYGWSFGGFMSTNLMLTHRDVFKVGVAGGPVMDWSLYEVMYGERYMDTPDENPEGYRANNLTLRAGDLKGRLLLIHGAVDPVVLWQHSQVFLNAAIEALTYPDYMVYPDHEHNVRGADRVHLYEVITRYFDDHLK